MPGNYKPGIPITTDSTFNSLKLVNLYYQTKAAFTVQMQNVKLE